MKIFSRNRTFIFLNILLISILLVNSDFAFSQINCEISIDAAMPVCYKSRVKLSVEENLNYTYLWAPTGETTSSINIRPEEAQQYSVTVIDIVTQDTCQSSILVEVRPKFTTSIEQVQLTCTNSDNNNGNTAMLLASANGNSNNYTYSWDVPPLNIAPGNRALAIGLKAHLWYYIDITDNFGCTQTDSIFSKAYKNPTVEIKADPDTAYIQNPHITFSFTNTSEDSITNHFWSFGDDLEDSYLDTPTHTYQDEGTFTTVLTVNNLQGCDTTFTKDVIVLPIKLKVPNIFTPNGDGYNDYFIIIESDEVEEEEGETRSRAGAGGNWKPLNTYYERTELVVFNRWGRKVYESSNYQNDWDGGNLGDGTYFYVIKCKGFKNDHTYKGSVAIFGSGR